MIGYHTHTWRISRTNKKAASHGVLISIYICGHENCNEELIRPFPKQATPA